MKRGHDIRGSRTAADRGTVLFLTMMVLLVIASIAFVAVGSTVNNVSRVGSFRNSMVAYNVTESGSVATMALGASNPAGFGAFIASHGYTVGRVDISSLFFDTGRSGSFGQEIDNVAIADWTTRLSSPITSHRAPGYDVGTYCFRKYYAITDGWYQASAKCSDLTRARLDALTAAGGASAEEAAEAQREMERCSQKRFVSSMYVGPVACE